MSDEDPRGCHNDATRKTVLWDISFRFAIGPCLLYVCLLHATIDKKLAQVRMVLYLILGSVCRLEHMYVVFLLDQFVVVNIICIARAIN